MELVSLHLFTLFITAVVIACSDHQGYLYLRGKKATLSKRFVTWSHRLVWVGLLTMITSGVLMVLPAWEHYLQEPKFLIKMCFVLMLVVNAFAIGELAKKAEQTPFVALSLQEKRMLLVSGVLSISGWIGAAIIGMFFL